MLPIAEREPLEDQSRNVTDLLASVIRACAALRKTVSVRKLCASTASARGSRETAADLRLGRDVWVLVLKGESISAEQRADLIALAEEGVRPVESFAWEILRVLLRGKNPHTFYARLRRAVLREATDAAPRRRRGAEELGEAARSEVERAIQGVVSLTPRQRTVLDHLRNAKRIGAIVSSDELATLRPVGTKDCARRTIQQLRAKGYSIQNASKRRGYVLDREPD